MNNLKAGSLNRRIQIQSSTPATNFSGVQDTWTTFYECWANITIQESQLLYSTAEFMSNVAYRITCRWTDDVQVTTANRILYTEQATGLVHTYIIQAVLNAGTLDRQLVLMCYENAGTS